MLCVGLLLLSTPAAATDPDARTLFDQVVVLESGSRYRVGDDSLSEDLLIRYLQDAGVSRLGVRTDVPMQEAACSLQSVAAQAAVDIYMIRHGAPPVPVARAGGGTWHPPSECM